MVSCRYPASTTFYGWSVHETTGTVPRIHHDVHEAASTATRGSGRSSVFSGVAAIRAQHDRHAGAAGSHFENAWGSSVDPGSRRSGTTPSIRVILANGGEATTRSQPLLEEAL